MSRPLLSVDSVSYNCIGSEGVVVNLNPELGSKSTFVCPVSREIADRRSSKIIKNMHSATAFAVQAPGNQRELAKPAKIA